MSMALVGYFFFGNIRWSLPSRFFFGSFFGFIIPGWESDIVAVIAVIVGFFATQAYRSVIGAFVPSLSSTHSAIQSGTIEKENEAERSEDLR